MEIQGRIETIEIPSSTKINQNSRKSHGDPRRFPVTGTLMKKYMSEL